LDLEVVTKGKISLVEVPYSEHSAFNELRDFCETFDTSNLIPTVNVHNSKQLIFYLKEFKFVHSKVELKGPKENKSTNRSLFDFSFLSKKKVTEEDSVIKIEKEMEIKKEETEGSEVKIEIVEESVVKVTETVRTVVEVKEEVPPTKKRPSSVDLNKKGKKLKLPFQSSTLDKYFKKK
jgi:hypothetical protein